MEVIGSFRRWLADTIDPLPVPPADVLERFQSDMDEDDGLAEALLKCRDRNQDLLDLARDKQEEIDALENELTFFSGSISTLANACEQAELLLDRPRFEDDKEATVVKAVIRSALHQTTVVEDQ